MTLIILSWYLRILGVYCEVRTPFWGAVRICAERLLKLLWPSVCPSLRLCAYNFRSAEWIFVNINISEFH